MSALRGFLALLCLHGLVWFVYRRVSGLKDLLMHRLNVRITPFCLHWSLSSSATNTSLRVTRERSVIASIWFHVGTLLTIMLVLPATFFLFFNVGQQLRALRGVEQPEAQEVSGFASRVHLVPVVPGINLPLANFWLYIITLFLCTAIHELGHAMAAVQEGVHVCGMGLTIVLFLPAVYVETQTDQLLALSKWRQLKIFCAGVWHNCVLAFLALVMMAILRPMCKPLFAVNEGLSVLQLEDHSIEGRLDVGDILKDVNGCRVQNELEWKHCMLYTAINEPMNICVLNDRVVHEQLSGHTNDTSTNCCSEESKDTSLCFSALTPRTERTCLPVRETLRSSSGFCNDSVACSDSSIETCMRPLLDEPNSRLIKLRRLHADGKNESEPYLYVGDPRWLYRVISVSELVPRFKFVAPSMIYHLETLLTYLTSFSAALALLNVVPCVMLDGQHIMRTIVNALFVYRMDRSARDNVCVVITLLGTLLLTANVVLGLVMLLAT